MSGDLPTILAVGSAFPPLVLTQEEFFEQVCAPFYRDVPEAAALFASTQVRKRHLAWDPRRRFDNGSPLTGERIALWEEAVLDLARRSAASLLAPLDRSRIGSFVMASCTGYSGPNPNLLLAREFGLGASVRHTFIGHMGCNAAFNAIKVALDGLAARPGEYVLVNCTETCTLHIRPEASREQAVIHALFGDASASLMLAAGPAGNGAQILNTHTEIDYETSHAMTWRITDDGFRMTLSAYVPLILADRIAGFVERLLAPAGLDRRQIDHWGIHPGGPKIVELIGERLELSPAQLRPAFHVLGEYGNCSSATILLILEEILATDRPRPGAYGVLMAFGPGLTMEGLLLRF
jgi:predicted naringenin-chalcone synthase